jgi:hypothetical protein
MNNMKKWSVSLAATTMLAFSASSHATVTGIGDWENGNWQSDWKSLHVKDAQAQFAVVTTPRRQGNYAARFTVRNGDKWNGQSGERSEVSVLLDRQSVAPGTDVYYAWSTYFDPDKFPTPTHWTIFTQWHGSKGGGGAPPLSLQFTPQNKILIRSAGGVCPWNSSTKKYDCNQIANTYDLFSSPQKGVWHDFVVRVKWSCKSDGILQVWHKTANQAFFGDPLVNVSRATTQDLGGTCDSVYVKQGLYRSDSNTSTHRLYHDGFTQGTNFVDVASHAHGAPCSNCTRYSESLSGSGASQVQPNGNWFQAGAGTHKGWLRGPTTANFDLELYRWNGSSWVLVKRANSSNSEEHISYDGTAGYYYWRIRSASGSGRYDFWMRSP